MKHTRMIVIVVILAFLGLWVAYSNSPPPTQSGPTQSQNSFTAGNWNFTGTLPPISGENFKAQNVSVYVRFDAVTNEYFVRVDYVIVHNLDRQLLFLGSTVTLVSMTTSDGAEHQVNNAAHNTNAISIGPGDVYRLCAEFGPLPDYKPTAAKVTIALYVQGLSAPITWNFNATNMQVAATNACE